MARCISFVYRIENSSRTRNDEQQRQRDVIAASMPLEKRKPQDKRGQRIANSVRVLHVGGDENTTTI
jgi:hypothetical protein